LLLIFVGFLLRFGDQVAAPVCRWQDRDQVGRGIRIAVLHDRARANVTMEAASNCDATISGTMPRASNIGVWGLSIMLQDAEIRHEGGLFEVDGGARIFLPS
jgi:hypothetical protein